jgi:hypothetical protein
MVKIVAYIKFMLLKGNNHKKLLPGFKCYNKLFSLFSDLFMNIYYYI